MNMNVCASQSVTSPARRQWLACAAAALLPTLGACTAPLSAMRVGSIVFPCYEYLFLARELGLLDEKRVRLVELRVNTDTLRALATGQLEAAALSLDELMAARADGVDLRAVLVFDVADGANVLAVRTDCLSSYGPTLRHVLQVHFAAQKQMQESPQRCAALMARRLQIPAEGVVTLYLGPPPPDLAQNRRMLAPGADVDQIARALQTVMVHAGTLPAPLVAQTLTDPQFLPL